MGVDGKKKAGGKQKSKEAGPKKEAYFVGRQKTDELDEENQKVFALEFDGGAGMSLGAYARESENGEKNASCVFFSMG